MLAGFPDALGAIPASGTKADIAARDGQTHRVDQVLIADGAGAVAGGTDQSVGHAGVRGVRGGCG